MSTRRDTPHNRVIDRLASTYGLHNPGKSRGPSFGKAVQSLVDRYDRDWRPRKPVPDAWCALEEDYSTLVVFEVEHTCRMGVDRVSRYSELWFDLDCYEEFSLNLLVVSERADDIYHVSLCGHWYATNPGRPVQDLKEFHRHNATRLGRLGDPLSWPDCFGRILTINPAPLEHLIERPFGPWQEEDPTQNPLGHELSAGAAAFTVPEFASGAA